MRCSRAQLGFEPCGGFAPYQSIDVGVERIERNPDRVIAERARSACRGSTAGTLVATPFDGERMTRAGESAPAPAPIRRRCAKPLDAGSTR